MHRPFSRYFLVHLDAFGQFIEAWRGNKEIVPVVLKMKYSRWFVVFLGNCLKEGNRLNQCSTERLAVN
jgi:hypothetical protein